MARLPETLRRPRPPTPHEREQVQVLADGRAERTRQVLERRQRDAKEFAHLLAKDEARRAPPEPSEGDGLLE